MAQCARPQAKSAGAALTRSGPHSASHVRPVRSVRSPPAGQHERIRRSSVPAGSAVPRRRRRERWGRRRDGASPWQSDELLWLAARLSALPERRRLASALAGLVALAGTRRGAGRGDRGCLQSIGEELSWPAS